jgi:hypothetical protein
MVKTLADHNDVMIMLSLTQLMALRGFPCTLAALSYQDTERNMTMLLQCVGRAVIGGWLLLFLLLHSMPAMHILQHHCIALASGVL